MSLRLENFLYESVDSDFLKLIDFGLLGTILSDRFRCKIH